jgi:repressor LexA
MRTSHENQQKILDFIKAEIEDKGYPPSVREICAAVGLRSTSTVHAHLNHLEEQGLIRRDSTKPRALEVLDGSHARGRSVPLVGRVTAGQPILAVENIEDYLMLPQSMLGKDDLFCLRVQGESMIDIGILDGDICLADRQEEIADGNIVVAFVNGGLTVKILDTSTKEQGFLRLLPANPAYPPIIIDANDQFILQGKVTSVHRDTRKH